MREWRANFVTYYNFTEGRFAGNGLGGAARWQDKAAISYPTIEVLAEGSDTPIYVGDISNPFYDNAQTNFDFGVSYQTKVMDNKVDWKIQLNVQNVFASEDDVIATAVKPLAQDLLHNELFP
ncbi:TonB-dependent receptor [Puniceicoccaceae bacterium K14]|nr:TonB-dependent receptor [Puniceicoccaceae bacterium K14]